KRRAWIRRPSIVWWPNRARLRWGRSSSATCSVWTPSCTWPSTCRSPTAIASTSTAGCASWSARATSARRPERGSMSTAETESAAGGETHASQAAAELNQYQLVDRFALKALVEACLLVEEGVSSTREIDLGMMAGAGLIPPPFARADATGLDEVLSALE